MATVLTRRSVLTSAAALAACAPAAAPLGRALFHDGHPHLLVEAAVAGKPCLAVLDNGAPTSGIDAAFARTTGLAGRTEAQMAVAGASFPADLLIDDLSEMAIATEAPVNAIIGMDLFRAYAVGLEFGSRGVALYDRSGFAPPKRAKSLPVRMAARREPAIEIAIDGGEPFLAVVDLGCSAPLLVSPTFAARHGIGRGRAVSTRQAVISAEGGLVLRASPLTSAARVSIAGHEIADVPVSIMPAEAGPFAPYDALVGLPLLRTLDLWLALPEKIWFRPTPRLAEPLERRYTGIQAAPAGGGLLIRHVAAASPGQAAGLKEGDIITALNGQPPAQARLREAKPGEQLDVRLKSGGVRRLTAARYY